MKLCNYLIGEKIMRIEVEKRLHRIKITLDKETINCPYSMTCDKSANCERCNSFFDKCFFYKKFIQ